MEKLSPGPQGKVFAIPFFALFKLLGRLPVVSLSKLFLIGHVLTLSKKTPQFWKVRAPMS